MSSTAPLSTFTPALKPPPGVVSNPAHPLSLAPIATITITICLPVITVFFSLRCYARFWMKRLFTAEDVLCIALWAGTVAYCAIMRHTMSHGGGMHMWDITPAKSHEAAYWFHVCAVEYGVMIGLAKIAVLWLYRRVFSPHKWSAFDIAIVSLISIIFCFYLVLSLLKVFECWPREKIWNKSLPGKCVQMKWILNISGGFNTVTDWLILLLPIHAVSNLQMNRRKKALVVFAFTFGMCAPIFATVGFVVRIKNSGNKDVSWKQPEILLWGTGELASSILVLCFPELASLFRSSTRRSHSAQRRPGDTTLKGWSEPDSSKRKIPDPYKMKSLMGATYNGTDGQYMELNDAGNNVHIAHTGSEHRLVESSDKVVVRNEFRIDTHRIM